MTGPPKDKTLTAKQDAFCQEYLVDLNATQAAIRAGYSSRTAASIGQENLRKPEIQKRISELQESRSARTQITADYILRNVQEVLERCMQRAPVMVREGKEMVQMKDGEGRDVWEFNSRGALGALDLLGKHQGLWQPDKNTGPLVVEIKRTIVGGPPAEDF